MRILPTTSSFIQEMVEYKNIEVKVSRKVWHF